MKRLKLLCSTCLLLLVLAFAGCQEKNTDAGKDDIFVEEDLQPMEGDELAMMEDPGEEADQGDDEMSVLEEEALNGTEEASGGIQVEESGTYTEKYEVASYIHRFGHLPSNYITKSEAQDLGWNSKEGNLDQAAPGKSIGGDTYRNYDHMLPEEEGRTYQECDIDFDGGFRNAKRIIFSNDGLIFYTEDHYETFEQLY